MLAFGSPPPELEANLLALSLYHKAQLVPLTSADADFAVFTHDVMAVLARLTALEDAAAGNLASPWPYPRRMVEHKFMGRLLTTLRQRAHADVLGDDAARRVGATTGDGRTPIAPTPTLSALVLAVDELRAISAAGESVLVEKAFATLFTENAAAGNRGSQVGHRRPNVKPTSSRNPTNETGHPYQSPVIFTTSIVGPDAFILDTGCAHPVIVPDVSHLDAGTFYEDASAAPLRAFDGHYVHPSGNGRWCGLPALVCSNAPCLMNPILLR